MDVCRRKVRARRVAEEAKRLGVEERRREKEARAREVAQAGPTTARLRIEERSRRDAERKNQEIDELILQQTSSIEAMNLGECSRTTAWVCSTWRPGHPSPLKRASLSSL